MNDKSPGAILRIGRMAILVIMVMALGCGGGADSTTPEQPWIEITPSSLVLAPGQTVAVSAKVHGLSDQRVNWRTDFGRIVLSPGNGNAGSYQAPSFLGSGILTVTSQVDPKISASVRAAAVRNELLVISPKEVTLAPGQSFKFNCTANYAPANLTWEIGTGKARSPAHSGNYGSIFPDGSYLAPLTPGRHAVICMDYVRDPSLGPVQSETAWVTVNPFGPFRKLNLPSHPQNWYPSITRLDSGLILVAGGVPDDKKAFLYDPVRNEIPAVLDMLENRCQAKAVKLDDGRVWITGGGTIGVGGGTVLQTTEFFNPSTNTFSKGPDLPQRLFGHQAILMKNGKVLIVGGHHEDYMRGVNMNCLIFDPLTDTLKTGVPIAPRSEHTLIAGGDGRVYIFGGGAHNLLNVYAAIDRVEVFDPDTEAVASGPPYLIQAGHTSASKMLDGRFLIAGSTIWLGDEWMSYITEIYDPLTGTIELGPQMMFGREGIPLHLSRSGRLFAFPSGIHGAYEELNALNGVFQVVAGTDMDYPAIAVLEIEPNKMLVLYSKNGVLSGEMFTP